MTQRVRFSSSGTGPGNADRGDGWCAKYSSDSSAPEFWRALALGALTIASGAGDAVLIETPDCAGLVLGRAWRCLPASGGRTREY